jgi:uncharacterized membrane protein
VRLAVQRRINMNTDEERLHLTKKIEQVSMDIEGFQQAGNADKKIEVLYDYLDYLKDELKRLPRKE